MITLTAMNIVRIAKIVALLAFFLPWAAVSCQGVDVATASGIELMQGKMTANPEFERQAAGAFGGGANAGAFEPSVSSSTNVPDLGINIFAIAAAVVVLAGLGLTFAGKGRSVARNTLVTSLLGLALAFAAFWWFQQGVMGHAKDDSGRDGGMGGMGGGNPMAAQMLDSMVQQRFGLWINVGALVLAAGFAGLMMAKKDEPAA